jgi:uncharacterized protein with LGFP repeats
MTAIDDKWRQIPWVGNPKDEGAGAHEMPHPDGRGRMRDFDNASIYWTPHGGRSGGHLRAARSCADRRRSTRVPS